jgi:formylmethanofuran dehydrogenase subunit B
LAAVGARSCHDVGEGTEEQVGVYAAIVRGKSAMFKSSVHFVRVRLQNVLQVLAGNEVWSGQQADVQVHDQRHRAVSAQQDFRNAYFVVFCQENPSERPSVHGMRFVRYHYRGVLTSGSERISGTWPCIDPRTSAMAWADFH